MRSGLLINKEDDAFRKITIFITQYCGMARIGFIPVDILMVLRSWRVAGAYRLLCRLLH